MSEQKGSNEMTAERTSEKMEDNAMQQHIYGIKQYQQKKPLYFLDALHKSQQTAFALIIKSGIGPVTSTIP